MIKICHKTINCRKLAAEYLLCVITIEKNEPIEDTNIDIIQTHISRRQIVNY